ncbi:hypothetical protein FMUBM48_39190 [Nocardia cyriacigeorgica]|nr:hypothetical protein FMUBM48_39190 [Nocardia cyriacigeorgica]
MNARAVEQNAPVKSSDAELAEPEPPDGAHAYRALTGTVIGENVCGAVASARSQMFVAPADTAWGWVA